MENDELNGANLDFIIASTGKRLVAALESIDKRLEELNQTLSSVVSEESVDPANPQKRTAVLRTYDVRPTKPSA